MHAHKMQRYEMFNAVTLAQLSLCETCEAAASDERYLAVLVCETSNPMNAKT